jgi:uncharacterized protein YggE
MKKRYLVVLSAAALLTALLVACASLRALPTQAAGERVPAGGGGGGGIAFSTNPTINGLWVVGTGEARADPEVARITFGVDLRGDDPAGLVDEGTRKINRAMSAIKELGVAGEDIKTVGYSLWVETVHDPETGMPTGEVVYHVSHQTQATVRDLGAVGDILAAVVQAGANTISEVSFSVDDPQALVEQARTDALQDATQRAKLMAEGLGITLGKPVLVTEGGISIPMDTRVGMGGGGMAEAAAVSISPGAFSVSVSVQVVYEIQ